MSFSAFSSFNGSDLTVLITDARSLIACLYISITGLNDPIVISCCLLSVLPSGVLITSFQASSMLSWSCCFHFFKVVTFLECGSTGKQLLKDDYIEGEGEEVKPKEDADLDGLLKDLDELEDPDGEINDDVREELKALLEPEELPESFVRWRQLAGIIKG